MDLNTVFEARIQRSLTLTNEVFDAIPGPDPDISEQGRRLAEVMRGKSYGGYRRDVVQFLEALTGQPLEKIIGELQEPVVLKQGCIVVPVSNSNDHDYTIGVPIEWPETSRRVSEVDRIDQNMSKGGTIRSHDVRRATEDEIRAFYLAKILGFYEPPVVEPEAEAA